MAGLAEAPERAQSEGSIITSVRFDVIRDRRRRHATGLQASPT
jgi:hypothetical protein